jgi:hypothetical protein
MNRFILGFGAVACLVITSFIGVKNVDRQITAKLKTSAPAVAW